MSNHSYASDHIKARELVESRGFSIAALCEAMRRGLLKFNDSHWRFADARNAVVRRLDGQPFHHGGKAHAETSGAAWYWPIGLNDIVDKDRRHVALVEGSPDALAALTLAAMEGPLDNVGVLCLLGSAAKLPVEAAEAMRGRSIRIFSDPDDAGAELRDASARILHEHGAHVELVDLSGVFTVDGLPATDLADTLRCDPRENGLDGLFTFGHAANRVKFFQGVTYADNDGNGTLTECFAPKCDIRTLMHTNADVCGKDEGEEGKRLLLEKALTYACTKRGQSNRHNWKLAGSVRAFENKIGRSDIATQIEAFDVWYSASKPHLNPNESRETYLEKFMIAISNRSIPEGAGGDTLQKSIERAAAQPMQSLPHLPDASAGILRLASVCRELQRASGESSFIISKRTAMQVAGLHLPEEGSRKLRLLCRIGVLHCVDRGLPGIGKLKTGKYRYLLPMQS
jgi:hypothetical protein